MKRLIFGTIFLLQTFSATFAVEVSKPNILLIIADDMGLDASPCYDVAADKPNMPNLQQLCQNGLVFDSFYTNPMCSPTRATMITGRYGFRTGVGTAVGRNSADGLDLSETTLFQALSEHAPDYSHAVIGKWHLATRDNGMANHPELAGVGHYEGLLSGTLDDYTNWQRTENGVSTQISEYITTSLTNSALNWIDQQGNKPWFLWLAHVAPHTPFHLPPAGLYSDDGLTGTQSDIRSQPTKYYFAALEALDHELGRLFAQMDKQVLDNTIVMFLGDNGSPNRSAQFPHERGKVKASIYEGGVNTPLIVSGPGLSRVGGRESGLVNSTDIFATIADLVGIEKSQIGSAEDSISFKPLLFSHKRAGLKESSRRFAYVEHFGSSQGRAGQRRKDQYGWAIRDDQYKYIKLDNGKEYLFDLDKDPYEQDDILKENPTIAQKLRQLKKSFQ